MVKIPREHRMSPLNHEPEALRYALDKSGLTQRQVREALAKRGTPVSAGHFSEMVNGIRNCRQPMLESIAIVLNCPVVVLERKREQVPA